MVYWSAIVLSSFLFIYGSQSALVTWAPNKSFNLAVNFEKGTLPCSKSKVFLPESVQESILIESSIAVSELILPRDGTILLAEGASIILGADSSDVNCTEENVYYKDDSSLAWEYPGVWNSSRFNKATPDAERIPCYDDVAVFPKNAQFTIKLPDATQYVSGLIINDRSMSMRESMELVARGTDGTQQFVLGDRLNPFPVIASQRKCQTTSGCPCQPDGIDIKCNLKYCPPPKCSNPIKPVGHCCEICGGSLLFEIDNFSKTAFKKLVKSVIDNYGAVNFVYHIGLLPHIDVKTMNTVPKRVQVIVMDKGEYTGASSEVVNEIGYQMSKEWAKNEKLISLSGSPISESGLGGKIALSMFFAVVATIGALFAYYYRNSKFSIADLRSNFNIRGGALLNRFQERSDSVVSLTRRDSTVSGLRESGATAFRNPLYDSKRGRVTVTKSTPEEQEVST